MDITTNIKVPQEILLTLKTSKDEFIIELKRAAAVKFFNESKLTIGQCAELAEMSEEKFINYLSEQGISIFKYESEDELLEDIGNV